MHSVTATILIVIALIALAAALPGVRATTHDDDHDHHHHRHHHPHHNHHDGSSSSTSSSPSTATTTTTTSSSSSSSVWDDVEHRCAHDDVVVPMLEREDAEYAAAGTQRPEAVFVDAEGRIAMPTAVGQIRIAIRTPDLYDTSKYCELATGTSTDMNGGTIACDADNQLTSAKRDILLNKIIPKAVEMLKNALSVQQVVGNLMVPSTSSCGSYFTIPAADVSTGVADTDFILYVAGAPTSGSTIAWCGYCSLSSGRPVVARMNFNPKYMAWDESKPYTIEKAVRVLWHEVAHGLGFSKSLFLKSPYTGTTTLRGKSVTQVTSANVVAKGKVYFGCPTLSGVEVEDQGGSGTSLSHWERRNLKDDVMAGIVGHSRISSITLAMFQDSGKYTANFSAAESMVWGYDGHIAGVGTLAAGCGFVENLCGTAAGGLGKHWCEASNTSMCTLDLRSIGYCDWNTYGSDITPSYFQQYAGQPTKGGNGATNLMDYCSAVLGWSNRVCDDTGYSATSNEIIRGYSYTANSRCLHSVGLIQNGYVAPGDEKRCVDIRCPGKTRVQIRVRGDSWIDCPLDGGWGRVNVQYSGSAYKGYVDCPQASDICSDANAYYGSTATPAPAPPAGGGGSSGNPIDFIKEQTGLDDAGAAGLAAGIVVVIVGGGIAIWYVVFWKGATAAAAGAGGEAAAGGAGAAATTNAGSAAGRMAMMREPAPDMDGWEYFEQYEAYWSEEHNMWWSPDQNLFFDVDGNAIDAATGEYVS